MLTIVSQASEKPPTPFLPIFRVDKAINAVWPDAAIQNTEPDTPTFEAQRHGKALYAAKANPQPNFKLTPIWVAPTLAKAQNAGFRTTPVFTDGKTLPFKNNQNYQNPGAYKNAVAIGLITDDCMLGDYDGNKAGTENIISVEELALKLGFEQMPPPFQTNEAGNSLHWLFRLPEGFDTSTLKASNDGGWLKHFDIKTGNQLCHLKPHKSLPYGIPNKEDLPIAPQALISALTRHKPDSSTPHSILPVNETPELIAHANDVLTAIPPNLGYSEWRNVVWSLASLDLNCGYELATNWSAGSPEKWQNGGEQALDDIYHGYDSSKGITFRTAEYIAKSYGWIDSRKQINEMSFTGTGGDEENGRLFALEFRGELVHLTQGDWLRFAQDAGWLVAGEQVILRYAKQILDLQRNIASDTIRQGGNDRAQRMIRHINRTQSVNGIRAMIEMAKSEPNMTLDASEFDADPWLLGVENGVLDLKSCGLMAYSPDVRVSKQANVNFIPGAGCPMFERALKQWQPDQEVRRFLQRLLGVCITGEPHIQQLVFFHGQGANGKSVLIELMQNLFGEYCTPIQTEMLMRQQRSSQGPSPDILQLKGARLAFCNELNEGARLDESRVKQLTGGDTLVGRAPYAKAELSFRPSHNLIMIGNHQPSVSDTSEGMWRRLLLIPFDHTIPEDKRDPNLLTKLLEEAPGILNWLIEGLVDYRENGLNAPEAVSQATKEYRSEEDILGIFIEEKFIRKLEGKTDCQTAYSLYMAWCYQNGHGALSKAKFTRRLKTHNINRDKGRRNYTGIEVIPFNRTLH